MDEGTYQTIIRDIGKYHRKYELKEGRLVKIRLNKELKVLKRNEMKPILSLAHEHPLSGRVWIRYLLKMDIQRIFEYPDRTDIYFRISK